MRCVIVRSLSDQADDVAEDVFFVMKEDAAANSALLVMQMLKDLPK